jgi:archaellum biogenesis protein FlaJ (TadC family)
LPLSEEQSVRLAEEFVCLIYLAYLQNMLARMRTLVLSMTGVFAMIALSVAFYPYTPRQLLSLSLLLLLLALGAAVGLVYAGLERDSTLSRITHTEPGSLGLDFWVRIVSFAGIPALGLLAAQFPEIADFISSWVEPGMNAVK